MLIVCLLIIYIIYNIINLKKNNDNNYNIDSSNSFKAIAVVLIFFGHILQKKITLSPSIFEIVIRNCGFIGISIFFFNSGYGYSKKYSQKDINIEFLYSHIFKTFFPYLIILILYNFVTFRNGIFSFFIPYSWYVFVITWLTFLYYICSKIDVLDQNITLLIFTFITSVVLYFLKFDYYVISQIFTFTFGSILAKRDTIIKSKSINYFIILILFSLIYILYLVFGKLNLEEFRLLQIVIGNIASCLLALLTYLLGKKIIFKNTINNYLNKISYWFYLTQSLSIFLLFNSNINVNSNFMIIISIIINCILSSILYKLFGNIKYYNIRLVEKK